MSPMRFSSQARNIIKLLPGTLISLKVFLWTYPISVSLAAFLASNKVSGFNDFVTWVIIGFSAHTAMLPFVIYAREQVKLSMQIALVLAMGMTRGAVLVLLPPILGVQDSLSPLARIANSIVAVFYWFQVGSIIVEYGSKFKTRIKEFIQALLEKNIVNLPIPTAEKSNEIIAIISHLQEKIVKVVGSQPSRSTIIKASAEIDRLVAEHIRPLSKSSWRDGELTWMRAGFISVLRRTLDSKRIPVTGVILLTLPLALLTQSSRVGFLSSLVVLTIWISITIAADRIIYSKFSERDFLKANLIFLAAVAFIAYPVTFFFQIILPVTRDPSLSTMVLGYLISLMTQISLFVVSTLLVALYDDQEFTFEFLSDLIKRGELEDFLAKTKSGGGDERFAQYLHAEVQSQLLACKLLLLKAAESEFELFPPEITSQIIERMEKIKQPYQRPVSRIPSQRLDELKKSWSGLAEIIHDLPPEIGMQSADGDVISQLIEEAVVNSIRHGGAKEIYVSAKKLVNGIEVTVRDNGNLRPSSGASTGLGSILFDTFTKNWSRIRQGEETVVTFMIEEKQEN